MLGGERIDAEPVCVWIFECIMIAFEVVRMVGVVEKISGENSSGSRFADMKIVAVRGYMEEWWTFAMVSMKELKI